MNRTTLRGHKKSGPELTTLADPGLDAVLGGGPAPQRSALWARLESPLSTYYLLVGTTAMLLGTGLIMVLSASSVGAIAAGNSEYMLFFKQAQFAVLGLIGAFIASRLPVAFWRRISVPLLIGAICLQMLVFVPGLGLTVNGNRNWLALGPIQVQPSEFGKIALVIFGASILSTKRKMLGRWRHALVPLVFPAGGLLLVLVLAGKDLGTCLVLGAIIVGVLWASGISGRLFGFAAVASGILLGGMVATSGNRIERITTWIDCTNVLACWQTSHGQAALADGGLGGLGLGGSRQKWLWLPEAHNDFIFAIIGEELGIGGTLMILVLFAFLALACYRVVLHSKDMFVRIATAGVMVWILVQAMINIASVIGLLPVIGIPLPLVSSGGSALVTTLAAIGMVVSFARSEPNCRDALAARPRMLRRSLSILSRRPSDVPVGAPARESR